MNEKTSPLDKLKNTNAWNVPDGYFDGLTTRIMAQLPEKTAPETAPVTRWERVKPWLYMAAMFVGISLMIKLFVRPSADGLDRIPVADVEAFYEYYEDQLVDNRYHETVYLDDPE
ncbi:MAG: hypothetical protein LBH61_05930 [Dysgonamonadaceae bacterium]|jgi:hypothetical protein|nr:hypothetical protein [Dysgonamonadaceae bacterium]